MAGTDGGGLRPGAGAPLRTLGPLLSFGRQLEGKCPGIRGSLALSKPRTPVHAASARGRGPDRLTHRRVQPWTHSKRLTGSPRGARPPSGTRCPAPTPPKAHAVPAGHARTRRVGWRGAASLHSPLPNSEKAPEAAGLRDRRLLGPDTQLPPRRVKVPARLSARRPDSGTEPAKGGAGRGAARGAGRRARAAELTHPKVVPAQRLGAGGRARGPRRQGLRAHGGQRAPLFTSPSLPPRRWLPSEKGAFSSLRTRRGRGTPGSKRDPGVLAPRHPRTKGLRLQRRHLREPSCAHRSSSQRADLAQRGSGTAGG